MRAYKVFRAEDGKLFSLSASGIYRVEYKMGGWITPPRGKFFIYKRLKDALADYESGNDEEVWSIEVDQIIPSKTKWVPLPDETRLFRGFWANWQEWTPPNSNWTYIPAGLHFCNELKLVKKIK